MNWKHMERIFFEMQMVGGDHVCLVGGGVPESMEADKIELTLPLDPPWSISCINSTGPG